MAPRIEPDGYQWPDSIKVIGWTGLGVNIYNGFILTLRHILAKSSRLGQNILRIDI